jgi:hypothetical protein
MGNEARIAASLLLPSRLEDPGIELSVIAAPKTHLDFRVGRGRPEIILCFNVYNRRTTYPGGMRLPRYYY